MERLAHDGQLMGYRHYGFWSCYGYTERKELSGRTLGFRQSSMEDMDIMTIQRKTLGVGL